MTSHSEKLTANAVGDRIKIRQEPSDADDRVSLAGVSPENALRALLATPPSNDQD